MARDRSCFFTVEGHCPFPVDMLRKEMAYPNDTESCNAIATSLDPTLDQSRLGPYKVNLSAASMPAGPEDRRWASFGWHVTSINGERPSLYYGRMPA